MERIQAGWEAFAVHLDQDSPPALTDADTVQRMDAEWAQAARAFAEAKKAADQAGERLEISRQALLALTRYPKECGAGVTVSRYWRLGNVDYKKVPQLKGLDLDAFRGNGREEVRVTAG